jgi:hypothetical protein
MATATKVGDGDVIVGMFGVGNVLTHVGNGMSAALMVSVGANFLTKGLLTENWFSISYELTYQNDTFNKMSDGKKAFVINL